MGAQPVVVRLTGQAHHAGAGEASQLYGQAANAARGSRHHHHIAWLKGDRARTAAHAVVPATNNAPAASQGTPAGRGVQRVGHIPYVEDGRIMRIRVTFNPHPLPG